MSAFFRRRIETTIEHLLGVLDDMEGNPDLEPETDEDQHDLRPMMQIWELPTRPL